MRTGRPRKPCHVCGQDRDLDARPYHGSRDGQGWVPLCFHCKTTRNGAAPPIREPRVTYGPRCPL